MKIRLAVPLLLFISILTACGSKKKAGSPVDKRERVFVAEFHPFWGGMAACRLERKEGKDALSFTYIEKKHGIDTTETSFVPITTAEADSLFKTIERINWTQPVSDGSGEPRSSMKISVSYKTGHRTQQLYWERMSGVNDLPADVQLPLRMINIYAPDNFRMF